MSLPYAHPLFQRISGGEWHPGGAAAGERLWRDCLEALRPAPGRGEGGRSLRVLDAGCGPGGTARRLAARGVLTVGLDRTPLAAWRAEGSDRPAAADGAGDMTALPLFCVADIRRVPLPNQWADVVLCQCVASLLPAPELFFAEAARLLRPGGVLGLSDLVRRDGAETTANRCGCGEACACADDAAPTAVCSGGCAAGARCREEWEGLVREAGFRLLSFRDESHELARLAASLVWYGDAAALRELGLCGGDRGKARPGYGVWLAVREDNPTNREE